MGYKTVQLEKKQLFYQIIIRRTVIVKRFGLFWFFVFCFLILMYHDFFSYRIVFKVLARPEDKIKASMVIVRKVKFSNIRT